MAKHAVKSTKDQGKTAKTYVSQGTISVHFRTNLTEEPHQTLHFVPGSDYSIKHRNKNFAVFVSKTPAAVPVTLQGSEPGPVMQQDGNEPQPKPVTSQDSEAFVREYDQVKVIEVTLQGPPEDVPQILLSNFALHQTKVEIEVTRELETYALTLTGITVPKHAR